jgi:3-oxoacyl-[acyl-carrier protein] reductase
MILSDVRAVITGTASGVGWHFALQLAEAGARVVAGDVSGTGIDALRPRTKGARGVVFTEILDVSKERPVETVIGAATQTWTA